MQIFPTRMCKVSAWRHSRLRAHWLMALVEGGGGVSGGSMYSAFPGKCSVSYLSFVYGRSLLAELNGGENSLHWKANMLPLYSIMTLSFEHFRLPPPTHSIVPMLIENCWSFAFKSKRGIIIIMSRILGTV